MKTDEPRDDEILGRALSRAIETAEVNETPYERSRIAMRPLKRGTSFWHVAALAASIVVAGALGSTLLERPASDEPVAQQPSPTVAPANTQAATATPAATPTPKPSALDHQVIYFARDQLPPVAMHVEVFPNMRGLDTPTAAQRIGARVLALINAGQAPAGTFNAMPPKSAVQAVSGVQIEGDLTRVDLVVNAGNWQVSGAARSTAVLQQLVYTATEEPGIRRVLFTQNGGKPARIDQLVLDEPLSREDVFGYTRGSLESVPGGDGNNGQLPTLTSQWSVDRSAPGLARFVIQVGPPSGEAAALPLFRIDVFQNDEANKPQGGKWRLNVTVSDGIDPAAMAIVDQSPLRAVGAFGSKGPGTSTIYELGLDDLRPWRVYTLANPTRIVVDVGGSPRAVSDSIAVYDPVPGDPKGYEFTVSGVSRTFEGTTAWRVRDSQQRIVASGFTTASLGTSAVWGTFTVSVKLPLNVSGNVTLEVYWASPRDGSDQGLVSVPLIVR